MIVPDSRETRRDVPGDRANRARWSSVSAIMRGVGCPTVDQAQGGFFRASIEAYWMATTRAEVGGRRYTMAIVLDTYSHILPDTQDHPPKSLQTP